MFQLLCFNRQSKWRVFVTGIIVISAVSTLMAGPTKQPVRIEPLEIAFDFATAIHADKNDQIMMQEKVVQDLVELRLLDLAIEKADKIDGWRQGTAYADIAVELARQGKKDQARELITKAEAVMNRTLGWQKPRIGAHIGRAEAAIGNIEKSQRIGFSLPPEEGPKSLAAAAAALANRGEFDGAMKTLERVEESKFFENQMAVVNGYIEIARHPSLADKPEQRKQALLAAVRTSSQVPALRQVEVANLVVNDLIEINEPDEARRVLDKVAAALTPDVNPYYRAPALAQMTRSWMKLGERDRALKALATAEENWHLVITIDVPETYAAIAAAYLVAEEPAKAKEYLNKAMTSAESLVNARPRAMAVVNTCRWMGRYGMELDKATRERLQKLRDGLTDPW